MKLNSSRISKKVFIVAPILVVIVLLPKFMDYYWLEVLNLTMINVISVLGLSIIFGYCGQASFCQATFLGLGGYALGILVTKLGFPVWIALIGALIVPALFALIIGLPTLRLTGAYFAIATMCFALVMSVIVWSWERLTGGYIGILDISSFEPAFIFSDTRNFFYLIAGFLILAYLILRRIIDSRLGRAWLAIRENEVLAGSMGVDTAKYKIIALLIGSTYAGLGGGLTASYLHMISPEFINLGHSFMVVTYVVVGGLGSLLGPAAATFLFSFLSEFLRAADYLQMIIYGLVLLLVIMFVPGGLAQLYESVVTWVRGLIDKRKGRNEIA